MGITAAAKRRRPRALEDPNRDGLPAARGAETPEIHLGRQKLQPRAWLDMGHRVLIQEVEPHTFTAVYEHDGVPRWPMIDHLPSATFEDAQRRLDQRAAALGWPCDPPLPPEDDPEPKPTRRLARSLAPGESGRPPTKPADRTDRNVVGHATLDVASIDPSPFQPRTKFHADELKALAESMKAQGQLQPVLVRSKGKRYELLDGERRLRAAKIAKLPVLRAEIVEATDREAREVVIASAVHRADLSPLETARAIKALITAGDVAGVTEAAKRLGMSQGHASNLVNLLDLPAEWQKRIESGKLPPTHARALLPHRGRPALLKAIAEEIDLYPEEDRTVEDFQTAVARVTYEVGRPIGSGKNAAVKLTPAERERLDIITVDRGWAKFDVAMNTQLFDELVAAKSAKREAKAERNGGARSALAGEPRGAHKATKAEIEAEKKREAHRRAEAAKLTARKSWRWKIDRLRQAIAEAIYHAEWEQLQRVVIWLVVASRGWYPEEGPAWKHQTHEREDLLGFVLRGERSVKRGEPWPAIAAIDDKNVADRLRTLAAECLWSSQHGPHVAIPDGAVVAMAEAFAIDLAALWKKDQKMPLGKEFFELHTREQLVDLAVELKGPHLDAGKTRDVMIRLLQGVDRTLPMPKELGMKRRPA
jgi:ParB/RepB/Spo0J family partition protein